MENVPYETQEGWWGDAPPYCAAEQLKYQMWGTEP